MRLRVILVSFSIFCSLVLLWLQRAESAITIATVPVGNPGNANDSTGFGGVAYSYSIGKYDVTVGQYTAFLNAVAATDTYSLYNPSMATDLNSAGISRGGVSGSYTYSVIGSANHPITYVSWGDAVRFANWLSNGQPTIGGEGNGTTETGSYTMNNATSDPDLIAVTRNANATWVIPTENEWYKAAYYDSAHSTYYQYPFSSSTVPTSAMPGSTPNTGNFYDTTNGFAVTGSTSQSSSQNYLTDVGAYTASASPYGAYDMGGNVFQWNESIHEDTDRSLLGGSWLYTSFWTESGDSFDGLPSDFHNSILGFRVAETTFGDFNRDGHVDARDIAAMMTALTNPSIYLATYHNLTNDQLLAFGDINGDGKFNNADLQAFLNYLKAGHGSTDSVPEPSTFALAVLAFGILGVRRRG